MPRDLYNPNPVVEPPFKDIMPINKGGTGADNVTDAIKNLRLIERTRMAQPNGLATLDANRKVPKEQLPPLESPLFTIEGPLQVYVNVSYTYTITNHDVFTNYIVTSETGTITHTGSTIVYTPTQIGPRGFTVNGRFLSIMVLEGTVTIPSIISPTANQTDVIQVPTIQTSSFEPIGAPQIHISTRWELSTDPTFNTLVNSYEGSQYLTSWTPTNLLPETTYYVRVRFQATSTGWTPYSDVISFTTISIKNWTTVYGQGQYDSQFYGITVDPDGNCYAFGYAYDYVTNTKVTGIVTKTSPDGQLLWAKMMPGVNYAECYRGQFHNGFIYFIAYFDQDTTYGNNENYAIIKMDPIGNVIWHSTNGNPGLYNLFNLYDLTIDNNFIYAVGYSRDTPTGPVDRLIIKMDLDGNVIWRTKIPCNQHQAFIRMGIYAKNNFIYTVSACFINPSLAEAYLTKHDSNGNFIWGRALQNGTGANSLNKVRVTDTHIYAIGEVNVGTLYSVNYEILVTKWDLTGTLVWQKYISSTKWDMGYDLELDGQGGVYIVGETRISATKYREGYLAHLSSTGDLLEQISFGGEDDDVFCAVTSDAQYLYIAGYEYSTGNFNGYCTGLICKVKKGTPITEEVLTGQGLTALSWSAVNLTVNNGTLPVTIPY